METFLFTCAALFVLVFSVAWGVSLYKDNFSSKEERYVPVYGVVSVVFLGGYTWYGLIMWGFNLFG